MCYDDNAHPPVPEGATGTAHGEDLVLEAADRIAEWAHAL